MRAAIRDGAVHLNIDTVYVGTWIGNVSVNYYRA